jgi:hypothetical protein
LNDLNQKSCPKKERPMIQICAFKEKEKEGGEGRFQLDGQWKVPSLVAFEMNPMLGGQWGNILLDDQWKVPNLVAFGRRRKSILFTPFHFLPHKILLKFLFHRF